MQEDDIKDIYPVGSLNLVLVLTRNGSLLLLDKGGVKVVLRHNVFAVCINDDDAKQPCIAVLRATAVTKALTASVYVVENRSLKMLWECKLESESKGMGQPSIAFLDAPLSLVVFVHRHFVWAGIDPERQFSHSREVFTMQEDGFSLVVQAPGSSGRALIVSDDVGIMIDRNGDPVGNSISFSDLDSPIHDIAVLGSLILVITPFFVNIIDSENGTLSKVELVDPQGLYWKLGTSSHFSSNLPIPLHCGTRAWMICCLSPKEYYKRVLDQENVDQGKILMKRHPEIMQDHDLMRQSIEVFMRKGFICDGIRLLEKLFSLEDHDPTFVFHLFPEYMNGYYDVQASKLQSLQDIWSDNNIRDADVMNTDRQTVLEYLFRVREFPRIIHVDGIDTLIMHVLIDLDLKDAATAFLSAPNHAVPMELADRLRGKQWSRALALLFSHDLEFSSEAICLWKDLAASGEENISEDAIQQVQCILANATICGPEVVLEHLPWVLNKKDSCALEILQSRPDLSVDGVFKVLPDVFLKCQYLQLAISEGENETNSYVHTELASALIQAILQGNTKTIIGFEDTIKSFDSLLQSDSRRNPAMFLARTFQNLPIVQRILHSHLVQHATYIDFEFLDDEMSDTMFHEKAIVAAIQGNHEAVLEFLVNSCSNVAAAIDYIKTFVPTGDHQDVLVKYILNSDIVRIWDIAGQLIASFDHSTIDAAMMIESMPEDLQLHQGKKALSRMIQSTIHRRRQKEMTKSMLRRALFSLKVVTKDIEQASPCTISEGTSCSQCSLKLGKTACVQVQNNFILCLHCFKNKM